jgi:hypothetical protein
VRARRGYGTYGGWPTWPRTTSRPSASRRSRCICVSLSRFQNSFSLNFHTKVHLLSEAKLKITHPSKLSQRLVVVLLKKSSRNTMPICPKSRRLWTVNQGLVFHFHPPTPQTSNVTQQQSCVPWNSAHFSLWGVLKCLGKFWRTCQSSRMAQRGQREQWGFKLGFWPGVDLGFSWLARVCVKRVISTKHHWAKTRGVTQSIINLLSVCSMIPVLCLVVCM